MPGEYTEFDRGSRFFSIMRPYTELDRYRIGIPRELYPHSTLASIFNLRSMSSQGTHLLIARRRNSINSVLARRVYSASRFTM